jgi:hypothetical protein
MWGFARKQKILQDHNVHAMLTNIFIKMNSPILKLKHFDVFLVFSHDLCLCCLSSFLCLSIHNYCDSWLETHEVTSIFVHDKKAALWQPYLHRFKKWCVYIMVWRYKMTKWLKQSGICENLVFLLLLLILYLIFIRKSPPNLFKWNDCYIYASDLPNQSVPLGYLPLHSKPNKMALSVFSDHLQ